MRPTRLELEGFASFRDPVTVDFADADLFVLSGPTGSGKSSVVDAMIFALYGTVPRYDDRRMVAPLISQGRAEARVRLDFTVGSQAWTAVRVVRRTRTGATTKEARLERWRDADGTDTVTVAGTADELTAQVEKLLGLRFDHFTSCIVLPQGAFQQFLHSKPKERQDLLVQLLDLDVYRRVGSAARDRATAANQSAELLQRQLDGQLAEATEDEVEAAAARVERLGALVADLDDAQPGLDAIREQGTRLRETATTATTRAQTLADVTVPDGVDQLVAELDRARTQATEADGALEAAATAVEQATAARRDAGDVDPLRQQLERLAERDRLAGDRDAAETAVQQATEALASADQQLADADAAVQAAQADLQQAQQHDLVAAVVVGHAPGDPCPVCDRPLDQLPATADADAVAQARTRVTTAERDRTAAGRARQDAADRASRAAAQRDGLVQRATEVDAAIATAVEAGVPAAADELRTRLDALAQHDRRIDDARAAEQRARTADRQARDAVARAEAAVRDAWQAFDRTWQAVADLSPPAIDREDLATAWRALVDWAADRRPQLLEEADAAQREVTAAAERWKAETARLRDACLAHDVIVRDAETPRDAAARELHRAEVRHDRLVELVADAARVRRELDEAKRSQRLAHALGQHLKSSNFEKWLLNRALKRLVVGATAMLHDLSDGAYSLTLDDAGGFAVIDHRNADEVRSARTLSGGETFLASLALALALSEHVADLAAQGAARLESLILDEGFGTLDADTLDVVATALEELGSRGRMVGVITHVGALAERLPVRYLVRKQAGTSTVRRDGDPAPRAGRVQGQTSEGAA